jgi:Cdc6-like AAA superfamily ATPase
VTQGEGDTVTILTPAIREAFSYLDAYLAAPPGAPGSAPARAAGNVIAIVGDYGTGKTHLAVELLRRASANADKNAHVMYVDAQPASFVELYRRFFDELVQDDVLGQVREYYDDVVIDSLRDSELTRRIAERLSEDRDVDARSVVGRLGLAETGLLQQVQQRLQQVTRNDAFGTALTLLLRPGFEEAVWRWLGGDRPDRILVERGIDTTIDTEEAALEAMGVFALLYGYRDHRFVLVIDELEKVLSGSSRPVDAAIAGFKKLLTVFAGARAFLVLSGLPDFLQVLGPDVQQRIGRVVHMSALTAGDTREFIIESQRLSGPGRLEPFTPESVEYLVQLAEGVARKIIRLCYHSYRRAVEEGRPVTVDLVREVARTHTNVLGADDIRARVRTILGRDGWEHSTNHLLGPSPLTRVDEWVYVGDRGSGCAILVTDSVLGGGDAEELSRRALAIQGAMPGIQTLLIVNGYIDDEVATQLGDAFNVQPLVYDPRSFDEDLAGLVRTMVGRVRDGEGDDTVGAVRDRVDRINRQQSSIYRFIEQLAVHLDAMRSSTDRRFDQLQDELVGISGWLSERGTAPAGHDADSRLPSWLPQEVDRLFGAALDALGVIGQVDLVLRQAFVPGGDRTPGRRATAAEALRSADAPASLGVAVLLRKLVEAFRQGVGEWYRGFHSVPRGPRPAEEESLRVLCRTYDAIFEYLPVFQLGDLSALTTLRAEPGGDLEESIEIPRSADIRQTLDGLGARVQRTMLEAVRPDGGG